ncbi:MAG: winged helix-turn-helix domain-containing protein [Kiritimatiellia bacterium]
MTKRSLTAAVAGKVRRQILSEKWQSDQPLPSEREMSRTYRVFRMTARRCLQALRREGLVTVQPGRGYFPVLSVPGGRCARHLRTGVVVNNRDSGFRPIGSFCCGTSFHFLHTGSRSFPKRLGQPRSQLCWRVESHPLLCFWPERVSWAAEGKSLHAAVCSAAGTFRSWSGVTRLEAPAIEYKHIAYVT